jgi:hypothetical protein
MRRLLLLLVTVAAFYAKGQLQTWVVGSVNVAIAFAFAATAGWWLSLISSPWNYMLATSAGVLVLAVGLALSPFLIRCWTPRHGASLLDELRLLILYGDFLRWWLRRSPTTTPTQVHLANRWARDARLTVLNAAPEFSLDLRDEEDWQPDPSQHPGELESEVRVRQHEISAIVKEMQRAALSLRHVPTLLP